MSRSDEQPATSTVSDDEFIRRVASPREPLDVEAVPGQEQRSVTVFKALRSSAYGKPRTSRA